MTNRALLVAAFSLTATACSREAAPAENVVAVPEPAVAPTLPPARDYVGRWTGVEGMFLDVAATGRPDRYRLTMQYDLDNKQVVEARVDGGALFFDRNGAGMSLRPTHGAATGLKYLAGKKDCLTVGAGEGYCRD